MLGIIQGLTEFLPISSSGHLVIFQGLLGIRSSGVLLEVVLHFGTLLAILFYYYRNIVSFTQGVVLRNSKDMKYFSYLLVGILPAVIVGYMLKDKIDVLFKIELVSITLFATGWFLFITRYYNSNKHINLRTALIIGLLQILALLPGISRSGITISTAMILGVDSKLATKFSFFMAIPMLIGALILQIPELTKLDTQTYIQLILGFFASFISGYFVIKWLIKLISENHFWKFSIYCWVLSIITYLY